MTIKDTENFKNADKCHVTKNTKKQTYESSYINVPSSSNFLYSPIQNPCHISIIFSTRHCSCLFLSFFILKNKKKDFHQHRNRHKNNLHNILHDIFRLFLSSSKTKNKIRNIFAKTEIDTKITCTICCTSIFCLLLLKNTKKNKTK